MKRYIITLFCIFLISVSSPFSSAQIININPDCPATTHVISDHTPEQIHIQLTQNPSEMQVIWATPGLTNSIVEYGIGIDDPTAFRTVNNGA